MDDKMKLALALQHIGMLLEFCDLNGYGRGSATVGAAREFWTNNTTTTTKGE